MELKEFVLHNASGLHARPAAVFVQLCNHLQSRVRVCNLSRASREVDGKSILGVLTLGAGPGHRIRVTVEGVDEACGMTELAAAIDSGLGESIGAETPS